MKKTFVQADLSGWLSPDEERLLNLYRDAGEGEQDKLLYRITRRRLTHMFTSEFDEECDARDSTYLEEELAQWLREICPFHLLGEYLSDEPHRSTLVAAAWGSAAHVLLGSSKRDGQRADELFNAAVRLCDMIGQGPGHRAPLIFDRKAALAFTEQWRADALKHAFLTTE
jgi:hypothetical protein